MKPSVLAAALSFVVLPVYAQSVRVVDGDTLRVDGVTYRLWGIDAPESGQPCADGWPAGQAATEHLRALIGDRQVSCEPKTFDRYGRTVAVCHVDDVLDEILIACVGLQDYGIRSNQAVPQENIDSLPQSNGTVVIGSHKPHSI